MTRGHRPRKLHIYIHLLLSRHHLRLSQKFCWTDIAFLLEEATEVLAPFVPAGILVCRGA